MVSEKIWDDYHKFTVVRDPFDKLVSGFFHLKKTKPFLFDAYELLPVEEQFRSWVKDGGRLLDKNIYCVNGEIICDSIVRYENLKSDLVKVCNKLEVIPDMDQLPVLKSEHRDNKYNLRQLYDRETVDIVSEIYAFEINKFNYSAPALNG